MRSGKSRPFVSLARHRRREEVVKLGNIIRYEKALHGNLFHSWDVICEECGNTWADIYFLSRKNMFIFYNATISMAQAAMYDTARDKVIDECYQIVPHTEEDDFKSVPGERDAWGRVRTYRMIFSKKTYAELDGLSRYEWEQRRLSEYLATEKPVVFESFTLMHDYAYGIGLDMIVDAPVITNEVINATIERFWSMGEVDWKSEIPVPESHLVYSADWYRECNLSMSNAIKI